MHYEGFIENAAKDALTNLKVAAIDLGETSNLAKLRQIWSLLPAIPKVIADRTDGVDRSWPGFNARTLLSGEESSGKYCCHSIVVSPAAALPKHSLADADSFWVVISGSINLTVGALTRALSSGAFAFVPRGASQALANRSDAEAELLLLQTPAGAERAFEAAHRLYGANARASEADLRKTLSDYGFNFAEGTPLDAHVNATAARIIRDVRTASDFAALRAAWAKQNAAPKLVSQRTECRFLPVEGQDTWVLLEPEESAGIASAFSFDVKKDYNAPLHHQPGEEEFFFVLDGEIQLMLGNKVVEAAGPGAFAFAPRFATHAFTNKREKTAKMQTFNAPGGHERGFEYAAEHPRAPDLLQRVAAMGFEFHLPTWLDKHP